MGQQFAGFIFFLTEHASHLFNERSINSKTTIMRKLLPFILVPALFAASCGASTEEYLATADSTSFANDITSITSPSRKIVKQADITCRTGNILAAVSGIEEKTRALGGLIAVSELKNHNTGHKVLQYKEDSLKEINTYNATAHLELRVPAEMVDSMLAAIPPMVDFIESRNFSQNDMTLAYLHNSLTNELHQKTIAQKQKEQAYASETTEQLPDTTTKAEQVINRRIENLQLLDNVNYTLLSIELTQNDQVSTTVIADIDYISSQPFSAQFTYGLQKGWSILKGVAIAMAYSWPFLLAGLGIWVAFTYRRKKKLKIS